MISEPEFFENNIEDIVDWIPLHCKVKQEHLIHIKNVNPDNTSLALRTIIDEHIRFKKMMYFEKHLISFSSGVILLGIGAIVTNPYIIITMYLTGLFMIFFSLGQYIYGKKKYTKEIG